MISQNLITTNKNQMYRNRKGEITTHIYKLQISQSLSPCLYVFVSFPATCSGKFPFKSSGSSLNCSGNPPDLMLNCRLAFFSTHSCRLGNSICYPREEIQLAFMVTRRPINLSQKTKSEWVVREIFSSSIQESY